MNRRAFVVWALIALVWANLPYLVGYLSSTPQNRFGGFFLYEQDGYSYLAKMRQGAHGAWDFHLPYTSEDEYQAGGIALMFYIVVGKLTALGLDGQFVYHAARLLSSLLMLMVLWRFIARFVTDQRWQLWTWWLVLFSGGWGLLASHFIDQHYVAYELIAPDASVFSILYGPPHVIFGFALLLIWIGYTLDSLRPDAARLPQRLIVANVLGGLAALSREAYGPTFAGVFIVYLIGLMIQRRSIPWRQGVIVVVSSIMAGLYGVYMLIAYRTIPGFVVWYQQNPFSSPSFIDFILGFAPLLVLGIVGVILLRRPHSLVIAPHPGGTHHSLLIISWLIAGPIMAYAPLAISRRMIAGWQIPLCILGAYALMRWFQSKRYMVMTLTLVATTASTFLIIAGGTMRVTAKQPPLFQTADQLAALDWLSRHTTDRDVVLSDWHFGNIIPTVADTRVFIGHPFETVLFADKVAAADRFFNPATSDPDRRALIDRWRISVIAIGPQQFDPRLGTPVFADETYKLYRITSP
jgi:hypothetical protein